MSNIEVGRRALMTGHRDCVYSLERSPRDAHFFSAAGDGMVVMWDLNDPENGQLIARVPNSIYSITLHEGSGLLCVGHNYEGVHFIDWERRKEAGSLKCTTGAIFSMHTVGDNLYVGDSAGYLHWIDLPNLRLVRTVRYAEKSLRSLDFNPSAGHLAAGFSDNTVRILDIEDLELIRTIEGHDNSVFSVRYSPDDSVLVTAGRDAHIRSWNVSDDYSGGFDVAGHMFAINNIEFSPDGKHFVTCSMDKSIKVWHTETFKLLKVIDKARHAGHGTSVNKLLWMAGGNPLISASDDRTISAWDIEF